VVLIKRRRRKNVVMAGFPLGIFLLSLFLGIAYTGFLILIIIDNNDSKELVQPPILVNGDPWLGAAESVPSNYTVAFIGDTGQGSGFEDVLKLIRSENASLVLHQGDLAYRQREFNSPFRWERKVNEILGKNFPYMPVAGNHETPQWTSWKTLIWKRMQRNGLDRTCRGNVGEDIACGHRGIVWYQSAIGIFPNVKFNLPVDLFQASPWKICSWHKPQSFVEAETRVPYSAFAACTASGALIYTGHDHAVWRSWVLSDLRDEKHIVYSQVNQSTLHLGKDRTIMVVSGVGGAGIAACAGIHAVRPWWASTLCSNIPESDPLIQFGAHFCKFNLEDAYCYFKQTDGRLRDEYWLKPS